MRTLLAFDVLRSEKLRVVWIELQDLRRFCYQVMARDACCWVEQLPSGHVLVDDDVASGVTLSSAITRSSGDPRSSDRMYGAYGSPAGGLGVDSVRATAWRVAGHVVIGFGPAGTSKSTYRWWRSVIGKRVR